MFLQELRGILTACWNPAVVTTNPDTVKTGLGAIKSY